jgi:hypothetical protein
MSWVARCFAVCMAALFLTAPVSAQSFNYLGGIGKGRPSVVAVPKAGIAMFVRGADDALWWTTGDGQGGGWGEWQSLGGIMTSSPSCVWALGEFHCFVTGTDQALWTLAFKKDGSNAGWLSLGGQLPGEPAAAVARPDGEHQGVYVFARGVDGTMAIRGLNYDDQMGFAGWVDWVFTGTPAAYTMGCSGILTKNVNCYSSGKGNVVYEIPGAMTYGAKRGKIDGLTAATPAAFQAPGGGTLKVAAQGLDNNLWIKSWNKGSGWGDWKQFAAAIAGAPSCDMEVDGDIWCGALAADGSLTMINLTKGEY